MSEATFSKRYRISAINETINGLTPGQVRTVQVTGTPIGSGPGLPGMPGVGAITWTFEGDEAEAATNFFTVGEDFINGFEVAPPPEA